MVLSPDRPELISTTATGNSVTTSGTEPWEIGYLTDGRGLWLDQYRYSRATDPKNRIDNPPDQGRTHREWSLTLSQEYTAADFFQDTLNLMPNFPSATESERVIGWSRDDSDTTTVNGEWPPRVNLYAHHFGEPNYTAPSLSDRDSSADLSDLWLGKSTWWLECNDCLPGQPFTVIEYEQDYDIDDENTPVGDKKPIRIVTITPGSNPGHTTTTAEVTSDVTGAAVNRRRHIEYLPIRLLVDANRDGTIDEHDVTTKNRPYRFWLNDDDDTEATSSDTPNDPSEKEKVPASSPDYEKNYIFSKRDLEDFCRLHINLGPLNDDIVSGKLHISLRWLRVSQGGSPAIKIFESADVEGSADYLRDEQAANEQISATYGGVIRDRNNKVAIDANSAFEFDSLGVGNEDHSNKCYLFEGAGKGKGFLTLFILNHDGVELGAGPSVWMNLMDVRQMFQRARITAEPTAIPGPWNGAAPSLVSVEDRLNEKLYPDPDETKECIVYVHGWRMKYWESINWAETSFKRLWHQGYKGRFASFRWSTLSGDSTITNGYFTYNPSEYRAWLSGPAVEEYINNTPGVPDDYRKLVFAHSMGNVVMASALKAGAVPERYVILNGAMAAMAYDGGIVDTQEYITPDNADDDPATLALGLKRKVSDYVTSKTVLINFGLFDDASQPGDAALGAWDANNATFKPQAWVPPLYLFGYHYHLYYPTGHKLTYVQFVSTRYIGSLSEAMGYVTQSRSKPIGSHGTAAGCIAKNIDLHIYHFGDEHSAEWESGIQKAYPFWTKLLEKLENK